MRALRVERVAADDKKAHEAVAEVMRRGFLPRESACFAASVSQDPEAERELLDLVRAALVDGVSVAAYLGDEMVGAAVNKIQVRPPPGQKSFFEKFAEQATRPGTRFVVDFMTEVDAMVDLFAKAGGDPILELMFLGVLPEAGRRGVGQRVVEETVQLARSVGVKGVSALWTSAFSAAIGKRLGFEELVIVDNGKFSFGGTPMPQIASAPHQKETILALFKLD